LVRCLWPTPASVHVLMAVRCHYPPAPIEMHTPRPTFLDGQMACGHASAYQSQHWVIILISISVLLLRMDPPVVHIIKGTAASITITDRRMAALLNEDYVVPNPLPQTSRYSASHAAVGYLRKSAYCGYLSKCFLRISLIGPSIAEKASLPSQHTTHPSPTARMVAFLGSDVNKAISPK